MKLFRRAKSNKKYRLEQQHTITPHMVWNNQDFYKRALSKYGNYISGIPETRCFFLQSVLRSLKDIKGDVAECGTRKGKSALYMLEALNAEREFFLFDSFEGLSDPVEGKDTIENVFDKTGKLRLFSENYSEIEARFADLRNVHLMKGWIPDRLNEVANRKFCMVHVDVDMYELTRDALEFFYDRLMPGGMIVCDDYGSGAYPGARVAMDEFFKYRKEAPIELPQGQAFITKI